MSFFRTKFPTDTGNGLAFGAALEKAPDAVTARQKRPYWKRPDQFSFWKKSKRMAGRGVEVGNYASPLARRLWYYVRWIGRVTHPSGWKMERHGNDGFLLHVVRRGEMWHDIRKQRHVIRPGQACLLDLQHDLCYGGSGPRPTDLSWVWINGKDMPAVYLELGADQDPVFPLPDPARVLSLLSELQKLTEREPIAYEERSSGLIMLLLAELFASRAERARFFGLGKDARPLSDPVRKGIDYILRRYDEPDLSIKHIAIESAKLTPSHFSRLFHKEVGLSPIAYLNRHRIEQARKYLTSSNQSVAEIARSVGLPDADYFTRMFVRIAGVTPLAYRKKPAR